MDPPRAQPASSIHVDLSSELGLLSVARCLATSQLFHHHLDEALQLRRLPPVRMEQHVYGARGRFVVR